MTADFLRCEQIDIANRFTFKILAGKSRLKSNNRAIPNHVSSILCILIYMFPVLCPDGRICQDAR